MQVILPIVLSIFNAFPAEQDKTVTDLLFIGTYTNGKSKGIYRAEFDPKTGKLSEPALAAETPNPSFLAIHPDGNVLTCVNEVSNFDGGGSYTRFYLDPKTGELKAPAKGATKGPSPCHINFHPSGNFAAIANYGGGNGKTAVRLVQTRSTDDGKNTFVDITYGGKSVNKSRQEAPHPHSVNFTPKGDLLLVADLGIDMIKVFRVNAKIEEKELAPAKLTPGAGPRHLDINRKGDRVYVVNELHSTVTVFELADEKLKELQTISTLPKGVSTKDTTTAEIRIHHDLGYVYASNRGHDSIAIFKIEPNGTLTAVGHQQDKDMKTPRNFTLHGNYLLAAGQASDKIVVFAIDAKTGELRATGQAANVPSPVCLRIVTRK